MNSDPKKFKAPFIRREDAWRMADQTREKHWPSPGYTKVTGRDLSLPIQFIPWILIIAIPVRRIVPDILPNFACLRF